jgi:hypothetical protein
MWGVLWVVRPRHLSKYNPAMKFGKITPRPFKLAEMISVLSMKGLTRPERTRNLKNKLEGEGRRLGYEVLCSKIESGKQEWLYDLVWLSKSMHAVRLACEFEWSGVITEQLRDFRKLLCVKTALKLFVYRAKANSKDRFEEALRTFTQHVNGENYVFCGYDESEDKWHCYLFRPKNIVYGGRVREVKFRSVNLATGVVRLRAKAATA